MEILINEINTRLLQLTDNFQDSRVKDAMI